MFGFIPELDTLQGLALFMCRMLKMVVLVTTANAVTESDGRFW